MFRNRRVMNWLLDIGLLLILFIEFYMNLTGLALHQWLGVIIGVLLLTHLVIHNKWVISTAKRFFDGLPKKHRINFLLDLSLVPGFFLIMVSGLVISTWFNLPLPNYDFWKNLHVTTSVATLFAVVVKIGLHWKWILRTTWAILRNNGKTVRSCPGLKNQGENGNTPLPQPAAIVLDRRHFLSLMGTTCLASLVAINEVIIENKPVSQVTLPVQSTDDPSQTSSSSTSTSSSITSTVEAPTSQTTNVVLPTEQPAIVPTSTTQSVSTLASQGSASSGSCIVRCDRRCSFPGQCRRYVDSNGNNLCDNGECV